MILRQALQNPGLFLEATKKRDMRKKKGSVSVSSNFPFQAVRTRMLLTPLADCEKQTEGSPSLPLQKLERDRPSGQGQLRAGEWPSARSEPAIPNSVTRALLEVTAPGKPARAAFAVGP